MEKSDSLMKKVIKEAKKIAAIDQMDLYLTDEEMRENDRKHDIEVATAKEQHERIVILYNNGVSLELLSKSYDLPIDEITKIIETYDKKIKEEQSKL